MNWKLKTTVLLIWCLLMAIAFTTSLSSASIEKVDSIKTDNYANTRLDYYYYIPDSIVRERTRPSRVLVMMPGLGGRGEHFVSSEFKKFADKERFIILAPSFAWDEKNWSVRKSYQYPSEWAGNALISIINKLKTREDIFPGKLYFFGMSAGAQFSLRFCLWKPELCAACAAHGSGGNIVPDNKSSVKFFVTVGKLDTSRIGMTKTFYEAAKNVGISVAYKEYDIGHSLAPAQITDSLIFFKGVK